MRRWKRWTGPAVVVALTVLCLTAAPAQVSAQGNPFSHPCPSGQAIVGLQGWKGAWMDAIRPLCASVNVATGAVSSTPVPISTAGVPRGSMQTVPCPGGHVLTGFTGSRNSTYVLTIHSIHCSQIAAGGMANATGSWINAFPRSSTQGQILTRDCRDGRVASVATGRADTYVHFYDLECHHLPGATAQTADAGRVTRPELSTERPNLTALTAPVSLQPATGLQVRGYVATDPCAPMDALPVFRWQAVNGAARYVVELRNLSRNTVRTFAATSTYQLVQLRLQAGNNYAWRVQAFNSLNVAGPWSVQHTISAVAGPPSGLTCTVQPNAHPIF